MTTGMLRDCHMEQVMELFCQCFQDDHFYKRSFPSEATRMQDMRKAYGPSLLYCLRHGDCRGIWDGDTLTAFLLCFDYRKVRGEDFASFRMIFAGEDGGQGLPYSASLHDVVEGLPGDVLYLLSVAVRPACQNRGLGACLIDLILKDYPRHYLVSDVSNPDSLGIYRKRNFSIREIEKDYNLIIHAPQDPAHTCSIGSTVKLLLPSPGLLERYQIPCRVVKEQTAVAGYGTVEDHGVACFVDREGELAMGAVVELDYDSYLQYQRLINVAQYEEHMAGDRVFYVRKTPYPAPPLMNRVLEEMLPSRQAEWAVIPDVFVSVPVQYRSMDLLEDCPAQPDRKAAALLKDMDFRTHYEAGVPSQLEDVDDLAGFKRRIRRYYLGKIPVQITREGTVDCYDEAGDPIGAPAFVDLYISIDTDSNCGVLTWYSLSSPFLISHLMDNIIRNNLMVVGADGSHTNFFDFVSLNYGVIKRGTPKIFAVIPKAKSCLKSSQIASLLAAETIYPDGENFGEIVDREIVAAISSEKGMGQYDRAFVCAYSNVVLQFTPDFQATLRDRLCEESITLFYIELILLEEAAIQIADREIIRLITSKAVDEPVEFLKQVENIYDNFSKTIDFWDIQVNYPTSQKSIDMLRQAFKIKDQLAFMQRNQAQMQTVFDTKCDIIDRNDSKRMDTSLAIISILAIFSAWIDGYDYIATWSDVFSGSVIHLLQRILFVGVAITAGYAIFHLFGNKFRRFLSRRRDRRRRRDQKK